MSTNDEDQGLVSSALLRRWQKEFERLGQRIADLEARRAKLKTLIETASELMPSSSDESPTPARQKSNRVRKPAPRIAAGGATWKETIKDIVVRADRPVPYSEIKAEIMKTSLADRLARSEKGFHGAISKLAESKVLVRYKAHLLSPAAYERFDADLKAGRVRDLKVPNVAHHSPMGEAIREFMSKRQNGATSGNIIWELRKNPEFAAALNRNKTHPYNVLKRLVEQKYLTKRGRRYHYVHVENEEPSKPSPEGSSEVTGGTAIPPNESPKITDLLG